MTPDKRERMNALCKRIQEERDQTTFKKLISELTELLDEKSNRLASSQQKPASK